MDLALAILWTAGAVAGLLALGLQLVAWRAEFNRVVREAEQRRVSASFLAHLGGWDGAGLPNLRDEGVL